MFDMFCWLGFCASIHVFAARIHGFKEGWASTMDEVDLFQRSIKPSWLRIWSFFSAAPLVTSHWNRSTIHQPVPWCSKMLVMSQPDKSDKFVNLVTAPGPFVSLQQKKSSSQLTTVKTCIYTFLCSKGLDSLFKYEGLYHSHILNFSSVAEPDARIV